MTNKWKRKFPKKAGFYWFYGVRFGNTELSKNNKPKLMLVKVRKIRNGFMYIADGHFMYESEEKDYYFQKVEMPELPSKL